MSAERLELRGDEAELFERYDRRLKRLVQARNHSACHADVDDACATAWEQLLRKQPDRDHAFGFLLTVAQRRLIDALRVGPLTRRDGASLEESVRYGWPPVPLEPRDDFVAADQRTWLRDTFSQFEHTGGRLLLAAELGFSQRELATREHTTEKAIERRIARARKHAMSRQPPRQELGGRDYGLEL